MKKSIALGYNKDIDKAPMVLSKGKGFLAERINTLAVREGIPVVEHPALAESLQELQLGQYLPESFYQAVADVLSFVYTL